MGVGWFGEGGVSGHLAHSPGPGAGWATRSLASRGCRTSTAWPRWGRWCGSPSSAPPSRTGCGLGERKVWEGLQTNLSIPLLQVIHGILCYGIRLKDARLKAFFSIILFSDTQYFCVPSLLPVGVAPPSVISCDRQKKCEQRGVFGFGKTCLKGNKNKIYYVAFFAFPQSFSFFSCFF